MLVNRVSLSGALLYAALSTPATAQTFSEVSGALGVSSSGATYGASWADVNGDGRPDLWLGNHGDAPQLLLNGVGGFSAASGVSGLSNEMFGASFADVDNDGDQDLFVSVGAQGGTGSDPNLLLINDGSGSFSDQAATLGLDYPMGRGRHGTWFDWNDDGRLDIAIINNNQRASAPHFESAIFTYDAQTGAFTLEDDSFTSKQFTFYAQLSVNNGEVADPALLIQHSQTKYPDSVLSFNGTSLTDARSDFGFPNINRISDSALADVNNDGLQDIIGVTANDGGYLLLQNANGLINATGTSGIAAIDDGQFVVAADFDNDKDVDLYVARSDQATGNNVVNEFYANQGDGSFVLEASARGAEGTAMGFVSGLAAADFNNDGFVDLIATNSEDIKAMASGPVQLFENQGNSNNFITITLEGVASNRDGIGAVVALSSGGTTQYRERNGGIHSRSQDDGRLHFGLGTDTIIDSIVVTWPDGTTQTFNDVDVNAFVTINQVSGLSGGATNEDPLAMFVATPIDGTTGFNFDGSASSDSDGTIVDYAWNFGDGTVGSGATIAHVFAGQGMYNVTLTVTDDQGGTSVFSSSVNAVLDMGVVGVGGGAAEAGNLIDELSGGQDLSTAWNSGGDLADAYFTIDLGSVMPIVGIDIAPRGDLAYTLDISGGTALVNGMADGPVAGSCSIPGGGARLPSALVACPIPETMARYLTIRSTNEADFEVYGFDYRLPPEMSVPAPLPAFLATPMSASMDVALDATLSTDPENSPLTYLWNLGDGSNSTNAILTHTYAANGVYRIELTVTNAEGESTTIGADVEVGAGGVIGELPLNFLNVGWSFNAADNAIDTLASGEQRLASHWKNGNGLTESAWITYDLGVTSAVEEIRLALRENHDFTLEIRIGDTPVDDQIVSGPVINCYVPVRSGNVSPTGFDSCPAVGTGRYITVRETIRARLQIFGTEIDGIVAGNNAAPSAAFSTSQTINTLDVTFDASMSADTDGTVDVFAWDFGGGSTASGEVVTQSFPAEGDYTVALAVTDDGGAVNAITRVVTVDPLPTPPAFVQQPQSQTVEIGESATFMVTVDGSAPITFQWQANGVDIPGATGTTYTFANPQLSDDGTQISVIATNVAAAVSSSAATLTVLPPNQLPIADIIATPTSGFNPLVVDFDGAGSSDADGTIASYAWDFGDGNSASGTQVSNEYLTPGTFTAMLTVTDDDGATGTATVSIVVDQSAEVIIVQQPQSVSALVGDIVTFEVAVTGTPVVEYQWRKNGSPVAGGTSTSLNIGAATLAQSGDVYDVVVTNPINTVTSQPATLTVNELPVASFTQAPSAGVIPFTVSFDASASTDNGSIVSYDWLFGDGSTGSGVQTSHEYTTAGEFVVTLTVTDDLGGTSMTTRTVSANAAPTAAFSVDTAVGLTPRTVLFDGAASGDPNGSIVDYAWAFGDGGSANGASASTSHLYLTPGEYTATLTVTDDQGATDTSSATVIANTAPVAALIVTPTLGLAPLAVTMDASGSSDEFGNIVDYTFDFGDGNGTSGASAAANHTYATPGDYTVTLTVTDDNGATDTTTATVRANTAPVASLGVDTILGLAPLTVNLDATGSTDAFGNIVRYDWDFGDGNVAADAAAALSHTFVSAGVFTVTLTVTDDDGVTDTASVTVTANTAPVAALTATPLTGLVPLMVMFDASASSDEFGNIVDYTFDFGDGNSTSGESATVDHDYAAPGDYTVTLTVTDDNGATDTLTTSIRVNTVPVAALSLNTTLGLAPLAVTADASGSTDEFGTIVRYDWDFGDGTTLQDGGASESHVYTTPGNYTVTVTVTDDDGASDTSTAAVTADTAPFASLNLSATMYLLPNTLTADASASSDAFGTIVDYTFDFGDGTVVSGPAPVVDHDYVNAGSYLVSVTVTDDRGFSALASQNVVTNFAPVANFSIDVTQARIPFTINVDAGASSDANGSIVSYEWNFGDGTTATGETASHEYTTVGTFTVELTVTDDQGATSTSTVTVESQLPLPPTIDQQPLSLEVFEGEAANFSVSASGFGPITYQWRRNGVDIPGVVGTTYTIGNVLSVNDGDQYTVIVTNLGGSVTSEVAVLSIVLPNMAPAADFTSEQLGASLQIAFDAFASNDSDGTIESYDWDFGDGNTATGVNPTHTYAAEGTYTVTLTVTDNDGDSTSVDMTFDVAFPIVSVVAAGANLADGARVIDRLPDGSLDLSTFWVNDHLAATAWITIDLGSTQTIGEAHLAPRTDRAYNIEVVVGDTLVNGKVQAAPAALCATPDLGPSTPTETFPCTFAPVNGRYVTLESTDVASFRLHGAEFFNATPVNEVPVAAFTATQTPPDSLTVAFDASGSSDADGAIVAYNWDFGDGNTGSGPAPTHTYASADNYQVTLTVTDNDGDTGSSQQIVAAGITVPTGKAPVTVEAVGARASSQGLIIDENADGSQDLLTQWTSGNNTANTWFTLDLGASQAVAKLFIAPRRDRDYQLMIFVGDNLNGGKVDGAQAVTCDAPNLGATRPLELLECALPTTLGRYVTVMADQNFRVYGAEVHIELTPPTEPVALFTSAPDGADPFTVLFDGSASSDPNGSIVAYDWNFGDGNSSTEAMPSHTYASSGDFSVTLTVTDNDGETASVTLSVFAGEAPNEELVTVSVEAVGVRANVSGRAIDTLADGSQDLSTHWNDSGNLNKSYITLDLGVERELTQLLLAPRDNRDYEFEIRVGNSLDNDGEVTGGVDATCTLLGTGGNVPTALRLCGVTEGLMGRYVTIRNIGTKALRIYGLEVYARPLN